MVHFIFIALRSMRFMRRLVRNLQYLLLPITSSLLFI
ncbi:hypothetical protein H828_YJM1478M00127 [Saccharomyces cerevisiae YJM1478]|uniref:Uncharacterized protein YML007C-A, mitochondrial n=6 Tax=Saccharomyces cerevisiae TaxID=4932 RepID=YM007_YEAST|eukprot:NP_076904.1 hypothetical protein YML007C-A [Saccharomyces cerevisiae S288C]